MDDDIMSAMTSDTFIYPVDSVPTSICTGLSIDMMQDDGSRRALQTASFSLSAWMNPGNPSRATRDALR